VTTESTRRALEIRESGSGVASRAIVRHERHAGPAGGDLHCKEFVMFDRSVAAAALAAAAFGVVSTTASAQANPALGALIGGGVGALIGHSVNGANGAAVGGVIGAVTGAGIAARSGPGYVAAAPVYYAPAPTYYTPQPAYVVPAPVYYPPVVTTYRPAPVVYRAPRVVYVPRPVYRVAPVPAPGWGYYYRPRGEQVVVVRR